MQAQVCILHHPFHPVAGLNRLPPRTLLTKQKPCWAKVCARLDLVAQDLTSWGVDLGLKHGLPSLLEKLVGLDGLAWLRLLYLYPSGVTPELLRFIRDCGAPLLPYLDIPLQHAHPDVLSRMGRPACGRPPARA